MSGELVIGGGIALLLLLGKKKKKSTKKTNGNGNGTNGNGNGTHGGSELDDPTEKKTPGGGGSGGGSQGGSGKGGGVPSNLAPDAVWVSPDCKKVVFGDETGEAFWTKKGLPTAQKFIAANYHDPYEVAKMMVLSMAPCVVEFPVMEDGFDPMEEEFRREMFNRDFKDVYYLVQFLHDKIAELMDQEARLIEFNDRCDVVFVGEDWERFIAKRMARFYIDYMYPAATNFMDHEERFKAWPLADPKEENMVWWDNVATAIVNRMHPECGIAIVEAAKKEPFSGASFFATRPGLKAMYSSLVDLVNQTHDEQPGGLDFEKFENLQS